MVVEAYRKYPVVKSFTNEKGKAYVTIQIPCDKCGGRGTISAYGHIDGGICYQCRGAKFYHKDVRDYTEKEMAAYERAAKRAEEKKIAAQKEREANRNPNFLKKYSLEGEVIYVVTGNSFDIKDELKEKGAKYIGGLGWFFTEETSEYDTKAIQREDVIETNESGFYELRTMDELKALMREPSTSEYQGTIGDKGIFELRVVSSFGFDGRFGTSYANLMEDASKNVFMWMTTKSLPVSNEFIKLAGTIKDHAEYKGVKQTVLTRCSVK